jgi:hypothetical protein
MLHHLAVAVSSIAAPAGPESTTDRRWGRIWVKNVAMRRRSPSVRTSTARKVLVVGCVGLGLTAAGCSRAPAAESASMRSDVRPVSDGPAAEGAPGGGVDGRPDGGTAPTTDPPAVRNDEFCERVEAFGIDPTGSADASRAAVESLRELRSAAPPELSQDFDTVIAWFETLASIDPEDPGSFSDLLDRLLNRDVAAAFQAIATYAFDACGVRLDPGPGTGFPQGD